MTTIEKLRDQLDAREQALCAVLIFHHGGPWTADKCREWTAITGVEEATTKVLCDHIRSVLGTDLEVVVEDTPPKELSDD